MKTISQVAGLTGISVRTLQYYDEIDLLKPSEVTPSGYRLYDDRALEKLQQILFFKELDFKLKEIRGILQDPGFDKTEAYRRQKSLLTLKRGRLDRLISLLEKLEKGEECMSFKEFDLSEYIEALEKFKADKAEEVVKYWGSIENFNDFIRKVKEDEEHVAQLAVKQFGSVEKYTEAMKDNLEHFSELMEKSEKMKENVDDLQKRNDELYFKLTSDLTRDVSCPEVQDTVRRIVDFVQETSMGVDMGEGYWDITMESCYRDPVKSVMDKKFGAGASEYIGEALNYYFHKGPKE